jgi:hypothetical protein
MGALSSYLEEFEVNEDNLILSTGKFDAEHISVPYFWDCVMEGDCETAFDGDNNIYFMVIGDTERDEFPELKDRYGVALYESQNGYVNAVWFYSRAEYNEALDNPSEVIN